MTKVPGIGSVDTPTRVALLSLQKQIDNLPAGGGGGVAGTSTVILQDTAQSIPSGTFTDVAWATTVSDADGWVTSSTTLTVPAGKAGAYIVGVSATGTAATNPMVEFLVNGGRLATNDGLLNALVFTFADGDTIKVRVAH